VAIFFSKLNICAGSDPFRIPNTAFHSLSGHFLKGTTASLRAHAAIDPAVLGVEPSFSPRLGAFA
jgi:hypothetical protein